MLEKTTMYANRIVEKLKTVLQSENTSVFILLFGFLSWFFNLTNFLVYGYVVIFVLTLVLCKDVKNIYSIVLFVAFFIADITGESVPWGSYITAIACAILAMLCFLIKNVVLNVKSLSFGDMRVAFIFAAVALLFGGIARFNALATLITAGLFLGTYLLYFIIINFTENFKDYIVKTFVIASVILAVQLFIRKINAADGVVVTVGTQHVNVFSEYLLIGVIFAFVWGIGKKRDWAHFIPAAIIELAIIIADCSTTVILSAVSAMVLLVIAVIKSPNKKLMLAIFGLVFLAGLAVIIVKRQEILATFVRFFKGDGYDNGRKVLWPWCYDKFLQNPIFGHGFISDDYPPTTRNNYMHLILAHNTPLQWLASLGVVGTSLMLYYYLVKYKIAFKGITLEKFAYVLAVIAIGVCGFIDQAPSMDFFMFFIPLSIIAPLEKKKTKKLY